MQGVVVVHRDQSACLLGEIDGVEQAQEARHLAPTIPAPGAEEDLDLETIEVAPA